MSNKNNDVFQVLVTKGNLAVLAAGADISTLAVGQLGAFDANSNVSIGAATNPLPRDFYFAVGIDESGSGVLEDIRTSAGQMIQKKGITSYTFKPHSAGRPKIVRVGGYTVTGDTDYGIKVEFSNSRISRLQGQNTFTRSYVVRTPTGTTDPNVLTKLMVVEIGLDVSGMLVPKIVSKKAITILTHGTTADYAIGASISLEDLNRLIVFNSTATDANKIFTEFTIQSAAIKVPSTFMTNMGFHKLVETNLGVAAVEGFNSSTVVSIDQELAYEEGSGKNVRHKEYHSSSWNGSGPYVLSETTGMAMDNIHYLASDAVKYDQFVLEYTQKSEGGWLEYENMLSTFFAIPATETVTRGSVATLLDALVAGGAFEPLADDAGIADVNPAVTEVNPASVATDGIA